MPGLGRFASADTVVANPGNPQSHNRFSYVLGNPIKLVDPSGHYAICFQQGTNEADVTTALTQICTQLAEAGFLTQAELMDFE